MAWNYNSYERKPKWAYNKNSKVDRILDDLQVYRIATGQINSKDYAAVFEKNGWDVTKLSHMVSTDDEKMGELAHILNEPPEEPVYYKSKGTKSRKRAQPVSKEDGRDEKDEKMKKMKRENRVRQNAMRKEGKELMRTADSNPLNLDFPLPEGLESTVAIDSLNVSAFNRPTVQSKAEVPHTKNTLGLVMYEDSEKSSEEDQQEDSIIEFSRDAPAAPILGPFCIICGKYGQYICDATDEDVCSLECKRKAEQNQHSINEEKESEQNAEEILTVTTEPEYIPSKRRFKDARSILDSHKCPICGKTGHLPQDCRLASGKALSVSNFSLSPEASSIIRCERLAQYDRDALKKVYRKCKMIQTNPLSCCVRCKCRSNLVYCVQCNCCFCDKFHLLEHLQHNPSHSQLYSFKLRKLLKCSNPNCANTNIYELFMCHKCSSTLYDKYYNMKTALWKREALVQYPSLICCEEHMTWHVMNCDGVNGMTPIVDRDCIENGYYQKTGIVNEMLFCFVCCDYCMNAPIAPHS